MRNVVQSELAVAEERASRERAQAEVAVPDPPADEAAEAIEKASGGETCT